MVFGTIGPRGAAADDVVARIATRPTQDKLKLARLADSWKYSEQLLSRHENLSAPDQIIASAFSMT
jgi:hypothetical protein